MEKNMLANHTTPDSNKRKTAACDVKSPFDLCETMTVASIRLLASAGLAALSLAAILSNQAGSERYQSARCRDMSDEENELLLHVLE
jgi:hypothetical protein